MSKIKSIFGVYSENLQIVVDKSKEMFAPTWYQKYFTFAPQQQSLTYVNAVGRSRIEAAASIIARGSTAPLRSRQSVDKYNGTIPAIAQKFKMDETDYRDMLALQAMQVSDAIKKQQLVDLLFGDVKKAGDSAHKRLDIMCMEAISTGTISITTTNNPDGIVEAQPLDLLMPSENKVNASTTWATAASADPIADIEAVVKAGKDKGLAFSKMLMSDNVWSKFKNVDKVKNSLLNFYYGPKASNASPNAVTTMERVNEYLQANGFPTIEIADIPVGIEKDGVISTIRPFNQNNVSFIPAGSLGSIKNAISIEEIQPVPNVNYATFNRALISKWFENEPFGEWTKVELNAFPAFEAIDSTFILTAIL